MLKTLKSNEMIHKKTVVSPLMDLENNSKNKISISRLE
jgi:hypothetical protein